jgi:molybdopterin converting factor small subunit
VLLFASYAEALKTSILPVHLPDGATVSDLIRAVRSVPGGDAIPSAPLVAVNLEYAQPDHILRTGDEIALIPATAGG